MSEEGWQGAAIAKGRVLLVSLLADSAGHARDRLRLEGSQQYRPLKRHASKKERGVLF